MTPRGKDHAINCGVCSQRGGHQSHQLVAEVGPTQRISQANTLIRQFTQTQAEGKAGGQQQPGLGDQAVIVKGNVDAVGVLKW